MSLFQLFVCARCCVSPSDRSHPRFDMIYDTAAQRWVGCYYPPLLPIIIMSRDTWYQLLSIVLPCVGT
jgi:hypothetical protein